ncbi:cysteine rich repeat-containing protein [Bradyrhizobium sp.]|uniref:cysteine rich repeat-containing protein n=1 Tax=Bradyrhizobium sp. TaxID=376 RepID=UPI002622FADD|nr:cysteine rich repeat-containing protein [Bradyrhizobium sp.]
MVRLPIAVIACVFGFSTSVFAQSATREACKADYAKYCSGVSPGGGRIVACLNKQHDQLSDACRKALDAGAKH